MHYDNNTYSTQIMIAMNSPSYVELYLGYVLIGIIGFVSNLFVIIILCSSTKLRHKIVNTLIIHQSVVDMLTSAALIGPSHLDGSKPHGNLGVLIVQNFPNFLTSRLKLLTRDMAIF